MARGRSIRRMVGAGVICLAALAGLGPSAAAAAPWWHLSSAAAPTLLRPGDQEDVVFAAVSNVGDAVATGSNATISIDDKLPAGLTAKAIKLISSAEHREGTCEPLPAVRCTFPEDVLPFVRLEMRITVAVASGLSAGQIQNTVEVQGGAAAPATMTGPLQVADEPTPFGSQAVELAPEDETGAPAGHAGSHPFQLTTTLDFNQNLEPGVSEPSAPALVHNLHFDLPPGLIGDPNATAQCSNLDFSTLFGQDTNTCPGESAVGAALVTLNEPANVGYTTVAVPVFNLAPAPGEPARFGFEAFNVPVVLDTAVRSGGDYSVQVNVSNATSAAQVLGSQITLWGEPGDPRHDPSRGWACIVAGKEAPEDDPCQPPSPRPTIPFLRLPTSCEGPLTATLTGDSWSGETLEGAASIPALEGCATLPFDPAITVTPEADTASTPTGLSVDVKVPQNGLLEAGALSEADVRDTTVTLPEGVELSPSAANGLQACSEAQVGFLGVDPSTQADRFTPGPASCPDASKVGVVHVKTPLLAHELAGSVYLAAQDANPFGSLVALYLVAEDPVSGVIVKLAGEGQLDEQTLRVTTTFRDTPQVPFEDLKLDLFGGPRASLSTPALCGSYTTTATFTPWSGSEPLNVLSPPEEFSISSGPGGSGCVASQQFAPGFQAESTSLQAGAFTPFVLSIARHDGEQALSTVTVHLPAGVAALLSSVTPCPEPQASQGTCGPESLIGHTTVEAGLGPEPVTPPTGQVFFTGPYNGAPFGLSIVTPAIAGPFNLGNVIVRSRISVDPNTAAVTITSDPLPTQLKGIPLQLKALNVTVDRPGFEFNPTSCDPMAITGTLTGAGGGNEPVSSPFQVSGCEGLPFHPKLTASSVAQASKNDGAALFVRVSSGGLGQASIHKVLLQLPRALPSRLSTIQKACDETVFNANPAMCDEGSLIGKAVIHTPVLKSLLAGPAYLVSHGGAAFPDVEFVLQGEGITLILDGKTFIDEKTSITYSRFETAPDAPFSTFETELPAGPHSALGAFVPLSKKYSLCGSNLNMPTEIVAWNGTVIKQSTTIGLKGCTPPHKLTSSPKLTAALKACRRLRSAKRTTCERQARKRYKAKKPAHKARTGDEKSARKAR